MSGAQTGPANQSPAARGVTQWSWSAEAAATRVEGARSMTLTACYAALCRLASGARTRDGFEVPIPALMRAMGARDVKAARRAFWELKELGLIRVQERKLGRGQSLPHLVWLVEGDELVRANHLRGGSSGGSTPASRTASTPGRETTQGGSPADPGSVVSREDRGSSGGSRSKKAEQQNLQEEHPLETPPRGDGGRVALDLARLQANGQQGVGTGEFVVNGQLPKSKRFNLALVRFGRELGLGADAKYVPEAVNDIWRRPSCKGQPLAVSEVRTLVRTISDIEARKRARGEDAAADMLDQDEC